MNFLEGNVSNGIQDTTITNTKILNVANQILSGGIDVEVTAEKATDVSVPSIQTGATALAANADRLEWTIQNLGTNPLFVRLASGASTTVFHVSLKAATVQDDGSGGFLDDKTYAGIVTVDGTSPRYTTTELTK